MCAMILYIIYYVLPSSEVNLTLTIPAIHSCFQKKFIVKLFSYIAFQMEIVELLIKIRMICQQGYNSSRLKTKMQLI